MPPRVHPPAAQARPDGVGGHFLLVKMKTDNAAIRATPGRRTRLSPWPFREDLIQALPDGGKDNRQRMRIRNGAAFTGV